MAHSSIPIRSALLACVLTAVLPAVAAEEPLRIVFKSGPSIPATALTLNGDKFVVATASDPYTVGQELAFTSADHVYGVKPPAINQAIVTLLMGKSKDAQKLLEPVLSAHRITAKISGNFWLEAARVMLVAYALNGQAKECTDLAKEISDATHVQGIEPFLTLGKALMMPASTKFEEREIALRGLIADSMPADICAYAAYFRGGLLTKAGRNAEALDAYLQVPCLYPSGSLPVMACAEIQAAELLGALDRRAEASTLCTSAARDALGTTLVAEANKRIESFK